MKMTFRVVVIGGLIVFFAVVSVVVFVPDFVWKPAQTIVAHEFTDIEHQGRVAFYSNGCNYCHTQYVREVDNAMGPVSDGGNYIFDNPMTLGSERTGPDLSYLGRKRSEGWDLNHLNDPRAYSPLSIMPSFSFLPEDDKSAIVTYLFNLGNRYAEPFMILPPAAYMFLENPIPVPTVAPPTDNQAHGWETWTAAGLQDGKELFVDRCLTCHGCAGNGLGNYAGTKIVTPADFKVMPFRNMPDDQWFWHVSEGLQGTVMPPWKESLTEEQRWSVIRYVQQVYARPIERDPDEGDPAGQYAGLTNPLPLNEENVSDGKVIFTRECYPCHGDAATGHGPYREGILPIPPDFNDPETYGTMANPLFDDADYFWRISEGVPWTAMPSWKLRYSVEDRWKLVHLIRSLYTQTQPSPGESKDPGGTEVYKAQLMPATASFERGKKLYTTTCAHCHGLAGDGAGWDGGYLNPTPADFRDMAGSTVTPKMETAAFITVTFGMLNTAMPIWGENMPVEQRWDAVAFLMDAWAAGKPTVLSPSNNGAVPDTFLSVSRDFWLSEGFTISTTNGANIYGTYCATCHGDTGQGDGPGTIGNASGSPVAFPSDMQFNYIFWRTWDGVPDTDMGPFQWLLQQSDIWDVSTYVESLIGGGGSS